MHADAQELSVFNRKRKQVHKYKIFEVNKIEKRDIRVVYCPTNKIVTGYSIKPTHGSLSAF